MTYLVKDYKTYQTLLKYPFPCYLTGYGRYPLEVVTGFSTPDYTFFNGMLSHVNYDWDDSGEMYETDEFHPVELGPVPPPLQGCQLPPFQGPTTPNGCRWDIDLMYNCENFHFFDDLLENNLIQDFFNMREFGYISDPFSECINYTLPSS